MPSNLNEIKKDLEGVMKEITKAKTDYNKLEGQEMELVRQLEDETGVGTIEEAEKKVAELAKLIERKQSEIDSDYKELKDYYDW